MVFLSPAVIEIEIPRKMRCMDEKGCGKAVCVCSGEHMQAHYQIEGFSCREGKGTGGKGKSMVAWCLSIMVWGGGEEEDEKEERAERDRKSTRERPGRSKC